MCTEGAVKVQQQICCAIIRSGGGADRLRVTDSVIAAELFSDVLLQSFSMELAHTHVGEVKRLDGGAKKHAKARRKNFSLNLAK